MSAEPRGESLRAGYQFFSHGCRPSGRLTVNKMMHFGPPYLINIS
jgi:hypothetical protein